jgi:hypothetical protein
MGDSIRDIPSRTRNRIVFLHSLFPVLAVLLLWINYLLCAVFHFDLIAFGSGTKQDTAGDSMIYLALALLATLVAPAFALVRVRKALSLARNGVEVTGTVTKIGMVSKAGLVKAVCEYNYQGTTFTHEWSHNKHATPSLAVGDALVLIIDPASPQWCMRKEELFLD